MVKSASLVTSLTHLSTFSPTYSSTLLLLLLLFKYNKNNNSMIISIQTLI